MPKSVQISMTGAGFEVTIGGRTNRFCELGEAVAFAREQLGRAQHLVELSARIE